MKVDTVNETDSYEILLCRLFGRMIDLPEGWPMFCIDLKQMMWERGLSKEWKRQACPDPEGEHNALVDAIWNQKLWRQIMGHDDRSVVLEDSTITLLGDHNGESVVYGITNKGLVALNSSQKHIPLTAFKSFSVIKMHQPQGE